MIAEMALKDVGDSSLGEWREWTGYAFHIRRRLSLSEQRVIGEAVDVRGTPEARRRLLEIKPMLPKAAIEMVKEELALSRIEE